MTIKHEKIAARVRILPEEGDGTIYRLSKPLQYVPYNEYAADECTWFVEVFTNYNDELRVIPWDIVNDVGLAPNVLRSTTLSSHAEALDALGYELIEEEK